MKKPIPVPAYMHMPVHAPGTMGIKEIARILQIEAKFWRREGQREAARALEVTASNLKLIGPTISPAVALDWPLPDTRG